MKANIITDRIAALIGTKYIFHHSATTAGYVSVNDSGKVYDMYSGRYGKGIVVYFHNPDSTRFKIIEYYIEKPKEGVKRHGYNQITDDKDNQKCQCQNEEN